MRRPLVNDHYVGLELISLGYRVRHNGELMYKLFNTHYFKVSIVEDVFSVEICGALKNVVGVAAGLVDGLK